MSSRGATFDFVEKLTKVELNLLSLQKTQK